MVLLDGRKTKLKVLEELKSKLIYLERQLGLAVIQIGNDPASDVYIRNKKKLAQDLDYKFKHIHLDESVTEDEVLNIVSKLNCDDSIDGILLQLPIPKKLNSERIINAIDEKKDVDGLTNLNGGKLSHGLDTLVPCTPMGIMDLLEAYDISVAGKCVVILGRSNLVGKPLASLMTNNDATVILCHSKTENIEKYTRQADILISAVGKAKLITSDMVKEGAVVVDVGINRTAEGLVGDVDFENVKDIVSYITPVPGGVGQMTVAELAKNTYKAHVLKKTRYK